MPAAARKRAADYTGKLQAQLQEDRKAELQEAATRIAMVTAAAETAKDDIVDLTDSNEPIPEAVIQEVKVNSPYRMIRTNQDLDQVTFGRKVIDPGDYDNPDHSLRRPAIMGPMQYYNFKEGQATRVPADLAEHLDSLGYLSFMGRG